MNQKHQIIWYWPGKVQPREFRFKPATFYVLVFVPVVFTAMFVLAVILFVSFSLKSNEFQTIQEENRVLRSQLGRVFELERQLSEMERFQDQVRRGLTEGVDMQRIMEAGEAVEWENPPMQPEAEEWVPVNESSASSGPELLDLSSLNEPGFGVVLPEQWPLDGFITRNYEFSSIDPGRSHVGIDIAVPRGTPVHAVADGTVISAEWNPRYGHRVMVDHGGGMISMYGHNELLLVETGDRITSGEPIALSGNSGISTAPHLHFEIWLNGRAVDPRALLPQRGEHSEEG